MAQDEEEWQITKDREEETKGKRLSVQRALEGLVAAHERVKERVGIAAGTRSQMPGAARTLTGQTESRN